VEWAAFITSMTSEVLSFPDTNLLIGAIHHRYVLFHELNSAL